jgi:hypothetical protein
MNVRSCLAVGIAFALLLCGTACSTGEAGPTVVQSNPDGSEADQPDQPEREILKKGEVHTEYEAAKSEFPEPLPNGVTYIERLGPEYEEEGVLIGKGMGKVVVAWTWLCAWETEYIDALDADDEDRAESAIAMIGKWRSLPEKDLYLADPNEDWEKVVLQPALLGDPSAIKNDLVNTCVGFPTSPVDQG